VGGPHAATDTRRDSDNSDASAPYFCVSCGRAHPEAAGLGPGIDAPFASSGSFGLANTPSAIAWWLWRETRPRPSHGAVSWASGCSALSDRLEVSPSPSVANRVSLRAGLYRPQNGPARGDSGSLRRTTPPRVLLFSWISSWSGPTVDTNYSLAQECCPRVGGGNSNRRTQRPGVDRA
jgi:hypothetical protein